MHCHQQSMNRHRYRLDMYRRRQGMHRQGIPRQGMHRQCGHRHGMHRQGVHRQGVHRQGVHRQVALVWKASAAHQCDRAARHPLLALEIFATSAAPGLLPIIPVWIYFFLEVSTRINEFRSEVNLTITLQET